MKSILFILVLTINFAYCQLDKSKNFIATKLTSTNIKPTKIGNYMIDVKLDKKTLDTVKICYNLQNVAKAISVSNFDKGINVTYFHDLANHFNKGFNLSDSVKYDKEEFFYDSKSRRLIIKRFSTNTKDKLTEVEFISDYEIIKNRLPKNINW